MVQLAVVRDQPLFSFVYDRASAQQAFPQTDTEDLVLAVLAGVPPEPAWDECVVYEGPSPMDPESTVCIGIRGAAADTVQERLLEAFERVGISIRQVYEGGPLERRAIARAHEGAWLSA